MKTSLQRILTDDGLELAGILYEPDAGSNTVLVHVHGMAGNFYENNFLDAIAEIMTSHGVAFFAFNNRGCEFIKDMYCLRDGKRDIIRLGNGYEIFEDCLLDIKAAVDFVSGKGFTEVHLSGHSLGAPKVAFYAAVANDARLTSVIFLSPSDMVGLIKADENYPKESAESEKMRAEGRGGELMPFPVLWDKSPMTAHTYHSLGSEDSKVAIFNFYNAEDPLETLSKITIPAFAVMGKRDSALVIPVEETMSRIEKALTHSPRVKTHILGDADHGYNEYEEQLAEVLREWIV